MLLEGVWKSVTTRERGQEMIQWRAQNFVEGRSEEIYKEYMRYSV